MNIPSKRSVTNIETYIQLLMTILFLIAFVLIGFGFIH